MLTESTQIPELSDELLEVFRNANNFYDSRWVEKQIQSYIHSYILGYPKPKSERKKIESMNLITEISSFQTPLEYLVALNGKASYIARLINLRKNGNKFPTAPSIHYVSKFIQDSQSPFYFDQLISEANSIDSPLLCYLNKNPRDDGRPTLNFNPEEVEKTPLHELKRLTQKYKYRNSEFMSFFGTKIGLSPKEFNIFEMIISTEGNSLNAAAKVWRLRCLKEGLEIK